jgi:hypothetical protein
MNRRIWSYEEKVKVTELYPEMLSEDLAKILSRTVRQVYNAARKLGLKKSEAFLNSQMSGRINKMTEKGKMYRYPKGNIPFNKGQKMPKEVYEKAALTMFKKGNLPTNTLHDGAISIRKDKNGHIYKHIRLSKSKWVLLHRHTWEAVNGEIPHGYNVQFKDGNSMNCDIDNLELVSKGQNMKRNSLHNYPEELKRVIQLRGVLNRQINKLEHADK